MKKWVRVLVVEVVCRMSADAKWRKSRARGYTARMVAYSAHAKYDDIMGMLKSGAAGYALKSEPPEKIVEAVRTVAAGGTWYSQNIAAKMAEWIRHPPSVSGDLTMREVQVLELLRCGMTNQQIAAELSIAASTVRFHLRNVYIKLGVKRRGEAIAFAADQGIDAERCDIGKLPSRRTR